MSTYASILVLRTLSRVLKSSRALFLPVFYVRRRAVSAHGLDTEGNNEESLI